MSVDQRRAGSTGPVRGRPALQSAGNLSKARRFVIFEVLGLLNLIHVAVGLVVGVTMIVLALTPVVARYRRVREGRSRPNRLTESCVQLHWR